MTHTPEPWTFVEGESDGRCSGYIRAGVTYKGALHPPAIARVCKRGESGDLERLANAARIVACVNACQGIPDTLLAKGSGSVAPAVTVIKMSAELVRLRESNAALVAALEHIKICDAMTYDMEARLCKDIARAALSKARP